MEVYVDAHEVTDLAHEILHHATTVRGQTRAAVHKVGYDMQAKAVVDAPRDTGFLASTSDIEFEDLGFVLGFTADYAAAVELGVPHPYVIRAKDGGMLRFVIDGREVFAKQVVHPPSPPQPYLGPAYDGGLPVLERALGAIGAAVIAP